MSSLAAAMPARVSPFSGGRARFDPCGWGPRPARRRSHPFCAAARASSTERSARSLDAPSCRRRSNSGFRSSSTFMARQMRSLQACSRESASRITVTPGRRASRWHAWAVVGPPEPAGGRCCARAEVAQLSASTVSPTPTSRWQHRPTRIRSSSLSTFSRHRVLFYLTRPDHDVARVGEEVGDPGEVVAAVLGPGNPEGDR